jgi:hypothetical protein
VVASLAARRICGARAASVTTLKNGRFETVAATDERATRADLIQYEIGAGPCVDAILEDSLLKIDDLHHDRRWPDYARLATELGWSSMLSYRLNPEVTSQDVLAGLNIYADRTHAFDQAAVEVGLLLATHGAMAVAAQSNLQRAETSSAWSRPPPRWLIPNGLGSAWRTRDMGGGCPRSVCDDRSRHPPDGTVRVLR